MTKEKVEEEEIICLEKSAKELQEKETELVEEIDEVKKQRAEVGGQLKDKSQKNYWVDVRRIFDTSGSEEKINMTFEESNFFGSTFEAIYRALQEHPS